MAQYAIEICGSNNEGVAFPPTRDRRLRGRYEQSKIAHKDMTRDSMRELARLVPVIPGMCIAIDTEKRTGRIIDLLNLPEGQRVLSAINEIAVRFPTETGGKVSVKEERSFSNLTDDQIKDWMYWMRRYVDEGLAVVTGGTKQLPSLEDIRKQPGKRLRDPFCTTPQTAASPTADNGLYKWADEVPVDGKKAKETAAAAAS